MKRKLIRVNTIVSRFSANFNSLMQFFCTDILDEYLILSNGNITLDNTSVLNVNILNQDDPMYENAEIFHGLGTPKGFLGYTKVVFSEEFLKKMDFKEKRLFILQNIQDTLIAFSEHTKQDNFALKNAYNKMLDSDYYFCHSSKTSRNKKYTTQIESRNDFDVNTYRLKIIINETQEIRIIELGSRKIFVSDKTRQSDMDYLYYRLAMPQSFKDKGWKKEKYYFSWGDEESLKTFGSYDFEVENYEYDAQNNELKRI